MDAKPMLLSRLTDPDPKIRVSAVREVRYRNLKDPELFAQMLALCSDLQPVEGQSSSVDPFAAFFGNTPTGSVHVADVAAERLLATGLPTDPATVDILASALGAASARAEGSRLAEVAARALGETRWDDVAVAVRALSVALDAHDVPLFHAITLLPASALPPLVDRATGPVRARLLQELMNHEPSRPLVIGSLRAKASEATSEDVLVAAPLLASWGEPKLPELCALWAQAHPWVSSLAAIEHPSEVEPLLRWLDLGAPGAPEALYDRHAEVARRRGLCAEFPLARWLAASGDDRGLLEALPTDRPVPEELVVLLCGWVADLASGRGLPERGWRAVRALAAIGRHTSASADIEAALSLTAERALPWDAALLSALASASPAVSGLPEALLSAITRSPAEAGEAVPALLALDALGDAKVLLAEASEAVIAASEAAPIEEVRVSKVAVRCQRAGIDPEIVRPLLSQIDRPDLAARLDALAPIVKAAH